MNGDRNPVVFLRRMLGALRGLKKAEQWQMYLAAAFLSIALSMVFALHMAFSGQGKSAIERLPAQENLHTAPVITPPTEARSEPVREAPDRKTAAKQEKKAEAEMRPDPAAEPKVEEKERGSQARPAALPKESGEWYYDKVHGDWRYKRI